MASFASQGLYFPIKKETSSMAIQAHLAELERRHQKLENRIADAMRHTSADDLEVTELKRQKLLVKDEIARIQDQAGKSLH